MTVFEILHDVQDARARVELWGVNFRTLSWMVGLTVVAMFFCLREILAWFLKIDQLRGELRDVKRELAELRQNMR